MHFLYIIYSQKLDKFYVGESQNVEQRLFLHNTHSFKKAYTKAANDWKIKLSFECNCRKDAIIIEKFIKKMKSRNFIVKVINQPQILNDILSKK